MELSALEEKREDFMAKRSRRKWVSALLWVLAMLGTTLLVLWLSRKIGQFASIADMFRFISLFF